jgi:hypothetical protein
VGGAGRVAGQVTATVVTTFVPIAGIASKAGAIGRAALDAAEASRFAPIANIAARASSLGRTAANTLGRAATISRDLIGAARSRLDSFVGRGLSCVNSFSAKTLVATAAGAVAIAAIGVGDQVLAYDEATGQTASYEVGAVHVNADPVTGSVIIGGETIETTPEHPFYTVEAGWLDAQDLAPGMHVPSASADPGTVEAVDFSDGPGTMYNLTVEVAHTFFVGEGQWLVHNVACDLPGRCGPTASRLRSNAKWSGDTN